MRGCSLHEVYSIHCAGCADVAVDRLVDVMDGKDERVKKCKTPGCEKPGNGTDGKNCNEHQYWICPTCGTTPSGEMCACMEEAARRYERPRRATDICAKAAELVGGERDRTHGSKRENFRKIAEMWNAYLRIKPAFEDLTEADVGHLMVLLKVARTQHGAFNADDYIDMCGYAGCAGEIAAEDAADA